MKKLLIVDNSVVIINVLKDLFAQKNDFEIHVAKSLNEVETLLLSHRFFMAVSNMVLPDALNGELLSTLKASDIPTVVLSSKIDDTFLDNIKKYQIIDYVLKDSINGLEIVYNLVELMLYIKDMEVLIVEDSISFANQIKDILESLLLKPIIVKNGKEALDILKSNKNISMVVTDLNMPEMDGLTLVKHIRKEKSQIELPILTMSSSEDKNYRVKLFKHGVNDFLSKPILEDEFKSKVIDIFSGIKKVEEIETFNQIMDEHVITSTTDDKGIIKYVSQAFCEISGYSKEELIGRNHNIVRHPDMPSSIYEELWSTIQSGKQWKGEIKNLTKDGSYYWVSAIIEPDFDRQGNIIGYHAVRQDITDKKRIYELSITDGLTGLYNRRYFNDTIKSVMEKTVRNTEFFAFLILDIDNFKKYNDTYGHQEGDNVLEQVANVLKRTFKRSDDMVFRLGGEEFGILMTVKDVNDAKKLAENARANIESLKIEHSKNPPSNVITSSFGLLIVSLEEGHDYEVDFIYKIADNCLYEAKENGRNNVVTMVL